MSRTLSALDGLPSAGCTAVEREMGVPQVLPPSVDLTTAPNCWSTKSPSPSQMVGLPFASTMLLTAIAPMARGPSRSVIGNQVGKFPKSSVCQTPPPEVARYTVLGLVGWTAIAFGRPESIAL